MIKLVENNKEAALVLEHLSIDTAPLLASKMFTEGFGVKQDFLQFYAAFSDNGNLCGAFVKCNDRVFCLLEELYDVEEIVLFLSGFNDFKIFIPYTFSYIIDRKIFNTCCIMKKHNNFICKSADNNEIDSKTFTEIIMKGKDKDSSIRFLLNNSHLQRHGYLKNHALYENNNIVSIASVYSDGEKCYLCNVFTPADYRNQGYATKLINKVTASGNEYHLICSEDVSALYKKCGFSVYSKWIEYLY